MRADTWVALRTPLLPLETFAEWAAAPDPRAYLAALVARSDVREALFVASPGLVANIERGGAQVERSLARYVARMAGRATPFGLFSGMSLGRLGKVTSLELAPRAEYRRCTRLDNDYLFAVVDAIVRDPAARERLRWRPNSSLYEAAGQVRYAEARLVGRERSYHLVTVEPTPYLAATLAAARGGATLAELAAGLAAGDPDIELDDARVFVDELATTQVLVPELSIPVTGPQPIDALVEQLGRAGLAAPAELLAAARAACAALDGAGLGHDPARYVAVARELAPLGVDCELARLFQVDMVQPARATVDPRVAAELSRVIEWLRAIERPREDVPLDRFRTAFVERFDAREVPLALALDPEAGVGFEHSNAPGAQAAPLLDGLHFRPRAGTPRAPWGAFERHMIRRVADAVAARAREIVLGEDDRRAMANPAPRAMPDAYHALARIAERQPGEAWLYFDGASGPSGASLLGRFAHASADIEAAVRAHLRAEEAVRPDAVFAEIVHMHEGRLGNVACRPVLRDHDIVYLGASGAPAERQLGLDDLLVSVRDDRVVLTSRRLGREVVPRLTNAHNFSMFGLPIYRFLCALQDSHAVGWSWGALAGLPVLPRVRVGDVVVSRATWNLGRSELAAPAIGELRARLGWPRFVALADGDNELPIDLDNPLLADVLVDEIAGRRAARIIEMFPAPGASPVRGAEGTFANELVLGFVREPPATPAPAARVAPVTTATRSFPPGSSWLYAKLYTGPTTADRVLRDVVVPVAHDALARGAATGWLFIRYPDPSPHLRVRFAGEPMRLLSDVLPALEHALAPFHADNSVWKLELDTYEREIERYGGDAGIELCEQLFCIDSEHVAAIIGELEGDAGADARWRLALRGSESLLVALGLAADARHRVFADARAMLAREHDAPPAFFAPIGERYKRERAELEALFAPDPARDADHELARGFSILAARDRRIAEIGRELRARELVPPLEHIAWSLTHMHVNRMLPVAQRAQELVICDLLRRLHEARAARAR